MMKICLNYYLLMAAVVLGLGISVTACSDDDDKESKEQQGADSADGLTGTAEEDILKNLIRQWCDVQTDELTGNWSSKNYEATEGIVVDESQPRVRSIQADDVDAADRYAISVFNTMGIDCEKPDGFKYTNSAVGTVSYHHSTEANTLAVIDVDIKLIPGLQQIRIVKTMPENANGKPYYTAGDIVKYKERFYVCTSKHDYNKKARFINFTNDIERSTGTFNWMSVGQDTVYNDDMASFETLVGWIANILLCDSIYYPVRQHLEEYDGLGPLDQLEPEDDAMRLALIKNLFHLSENSFFDINSTDHISQAEFYYKEKQRRNDLDLYVFTPRILLANKVRWTQPALSSWDQWVPYVHCVWNHEFGNYYSFIMNDESQTTLDPDHFKWQTVLINKPQRVDIYDDDVAKSYNKSAGWYWICLSAVHWRHEYYMVGKWAPGEPDSRTKARALMNFTHDWENHPMSRLRTLYSKPENKWIKRALTSREITFTDNGRENSKYLTIYNRGLDPNPNYQFPIQARKR